MIVHRSVFRELLLNFLMTAVFISTVLCMEKIFHITRQIGSKGVELTDIARVFVFLQPSILLLSLPMAILIAVFLTYGRMTTDNELVVLKGSGMSFWSISRPAIVLSVMGFLLLSFISIYLLPKSVRSFKKTLYETITRKASMAIEEETFSTVFSKTVVFVKEVRPDDGLKGIFVYREGNTKEPLLIVAEEGAVHSNPEDGIINLNMQRGMIHTFGKGTSSEAVFSEYNFVLTTVVTSDRRLKPSERGIVELWNGRKQSVPWVVELNRRLAVPFTSLIFGFLGPALSTRMGKTGRLGGFSFSLFILIVYYIVMISGEGLAKAERLSPFLGSWAPNILFGVMAVIFFYLAYRDKLLFGRR